MRAISWVCSLVFALVVLARVSDGFGHPSIRSAPASWRGHIRFDRTTGTAGIRAADLPR